MSNLLPNKVLSLSGCICELVPGTWAISWANESVEDRIKNADLARIHEKRIAATEWSTAAMESGELGWMSTFRAAKPAREFARLFLPENSNALLIELKLHEDYKDQFLAEGMPELPTDVGLPAIYENVSAGIAGEPFGTALGWDILGYEHPYADLHSYLCNGLEVGLAERMHIKPGPFGLIADEKSALNAALDCNRDDIESEDGFWAPWEVIQHSIVHR